MIFRKIRDLRQQEQESRLALREAKERDLEVRKLSLNFKMMRERNHFGDQIQSIMEGGRR